MNLNTVLSMFFIGSCKMIVAGSTIAETSCTGNLIVKSYFTKGDRVIVDKAAALGSAGFTQSFPSGVIGNIKFITEVGVAQAIIQGSASR